IVQLRLHNFGTSLVLGKYSSCMFFMFFECCKILITRVADGLGFEIGTTVFFFFFLLDKPLQHWDQ
ncbi:hypothetical protein S245_007606, partial [Arachis hypogaea]